MEARKEFYVASEIWDKDLSCRAQTVFMYLSYCSNKFGECYPSVSRIAKECGMCENTARKMINELVDKGFISCRHRSIKTDKGNRQTSNVYRILADRSCGKSAKDKLERSDPPKPAGEKPAPKEPEINHEAAKASASPGKADEDDIAGLDALLKRLGIRELYEDKYAGKAVELAISELWFAEKTKVCGDEVNKLRMRRRLKELDINAIDYVMFSIGADNIENDTAYLKACIYNAPMRANARIAVQCAGVRRYGAGAKYREVDETEP